MLAMVLSSTTISCAIEMSTRAQPRCELLARVARASASSLRRRSWWSCRCFVSWIGQGPGGREDDLVDHAATMGSSVGGSPRT